MDENLRFQLTKVAVVGILVAPFILYIVIRAVFSHFRRRKQRERKAQRLIEEADTFLARATAEGVEAIETKLILPDGEHALLSDACTLYETRATRVYGGAGTSLRGVSVGGGVGSSVQQLRRIDDGELTLTTRRLIFDGTTQNRALKLADILSVEPMLDAIEVSVSRRQKSLVFSVSNPFVWAPMITGAAKKG